MKCLYLIFPQAFYAYIDLGSGSYILQLIVGILFGGLLAVKIFWNSIKTFFGNLFSKRGKREKIIHLHVTRSRIHTE